MGETRCIILGSGTYPLITDATHHHPGPAFNRLFCFIRGSAQVTMGRRVISLDSSHSWLLPTGRSFRVTYAAGSFFHFFHFRWLGPLGQELFATDASVSGRNLGELSSMLVSAHGPEAGGERKHWHPLLFASIAAFQPQGMRSYQRCERHQDLIAHVHRHAGNGLNVASLARREGISSAALSKRFRRDTGMGLKHWLLSTTMERARERLATSASSIQEVASLLGYSDPFHFQRAFKNVVGLTPSAFRRSLRLGEEGA